MHYKLGCSTITLLIYFITYIRLHFHYLLKSDFDFIHLIVLSFHLYECYTIIPHSTIQSLYYYAFSATITTERKNKYA